MPKARPTAGDPDDPRALALARSRYERLARAARYSRPAPSWDELTDRQRKARITTACEWIKDAYFAYLLSNEPQLQPSKEQFAAVEEFLTARKSEIDRASAEGVIPVQVLQAVDHVRGRIIENLATVRMALYGDADYDFKPAWTPRAQAAWADTLRCAQDFSSHADYAPETWTP